MKKPEIPIPLRSVVGLPPWLMWTGVVVSGLCMLGGLVMIVQGIVTGVTATEVYDATVRGRTAGAIGGGIGCLIGGAGGMFGTLRSWSNRIPANWLLPLVREDHTNPLYRRVFWPALAVFVLSLAIGVAFGPWGWLWGFLQTSGILLCISGCIEAGRRHTVRQARTVFALYADGQLDADDTAAIDDARAKVEGFDADLQDYLRVSERVRAFTNG